MAKEQISRYEHLKELRDYLEKEIVKDFPNIKIVNFNLTTELNRAVCPSGSDLASARSG